MEHQEFRPALYFELYRQGVGVSLDAVLFAAASNRGAAASPALKPMARAKKSLLLFMKNSLSFGEGVPYRTLHPH